MTPEGLTEYQRLRCQRMSEQSETKKPSNVRPCPNYFRPVRTMAPLTLKPLYTQLPKGTVVRVSTVERWSREKEAGRVKPGRRLPRAERALRRRRALRRWADD